MIARVLATDTGWKQYEKQNTVWDTHVGRNMSDVRSFVGNSVDVWATLSEDLVQSNWAASTRRQYQSWLNHFLFFCAWCSVAALPFPAEVFTQWVTRIATKYAYGTVQIAASAVIGFCLMNNFRHPFKDNPMCKLAVRAAQRVKCGSSKPLRAALDASFIVDIWRCLAKMKKWSPLSIINRRARCFTQIAFEAAMRGDEISNMKVCDVMFEACGAACGHTCKSHAHSDAILFVRIHKMSRGGR